MMRKEFSFLVFNHIGSPIKRMTVSKKALHISAWAAVLVIVALALFTADYLSLRKARQQASAYRRHILQQEDKINHQRAQIQEFAVKINALKSHLAGLSDFEQRLRVIANLDGKDEAPEGFLGVGGSMPEDLDPTIEMKERQSALLREMHEQVDHLDTAVVSQQERFQALYNHLEEQRNILAATPAIRPVEGGWVSSSFGYRESPFTGRREFHRGLDIATRSGSAILATADGVVTFSGKKGLMGNTIVIDHGYGFVTRYGHAKELLKKRGDKVRRGDVIARVGNTGRSTGPHVHYEVRLNGVTVNPGRYILN